MRMLLTILTIAFLLSACNHRLIPIKTVIKDSIVEKQTTITKRDTTYLKGDIITVGVAIPCPDAKLDTVIKKGKTTLSATILKGYLHIDCHTDSLQHIIDSITLVKKKEVYHSETKEVPVEGIKYKVPKWCWWLLAAFAASVVWKFRRPLLALLKITV